MDFLLKQVSNSRIREMPKMWRKYKGRSMWWLWYHTGTGKVKSNFTGVFPEWVKWGSIKEWKRHINVKVQVEYGRNEWKHLVNNTLPGGENETV